MPWVNSKCVGCGNCVKVCPVPGAIRIENKRAVINNSICTRCGECFDVCPTDAIRPNYENPSLRGGGMGRGRGLGRGMDRGTGMGRGLGRGMGRGMGRGRGRPW